MPLNLRLGSSWSTHSILKRKDKSNKSSNQSSQATTIQSTIKDEETEEEVNSIPSLHIANHQQHINPNNQYYNLNNHNHIHNHNDGNPFYSSPPLPNRPTLSNSNSNSNSNSISISNQSSSSSSNHNLLPSLQPFSPEFTIAILHLQNSSSAIKSTIESRLTSTGFKFTSQLTINLSSDNLHLINHLSPIPKSGFQIGTNLIYLLHRARAIQVWKDLVGHTTNTHQSTTISRPGSLSSMFGKDVIWAAENVEVVYELICKFWSNEEYKFDSQFIQLHDHHQSSRSHQVQLPPSPHLNSFPTSNPRLHSSPIQFSSSEQPLLEDPAAKPKKRVFKFSHRVSDGPPSELLSKAVQSGPTLPNLAREGLFSTTPQHDASSNHQALGVKILTAEGDENSIASDQPAEDCEGSEDKQPTPSNSPHRPSFVTTPRSSSTHTSFDTLPNALESPSPTQSTQPTQPSSPPPSTLFRVSRSTSQTSESLHSPCSLSSTANSIHSTEHSSTPNLLRSTPPTITTTTSHTEPILSQSQSQSSCSSRSSLIFKSENTRTTQTPKMTSVTTTTSSFKARPLPASNAQPDSSPRMSKAAMLRLGLPWSPPTRSISPSGTPESETSRVIPSVASLNPPTVAPRATKASTLRADGSLPVDSNQPRVKKSESEIFENTPGHSFRRRSLIIPSIATPKTAPRANKSSALRAGELITANPKEKREKVDEKAIFCNTPGHKRAERIEVKSNRAPEVEVRATRSSTLRALSDPSNPNSVNALNKSQTTGMSKSQRSQGVHSRTSFEGVPGHKRSVPIPVAVLKRPPTTLPRMNRTTELRGVIVGIEEEEAEEEEEDMNSFSNDDGSTSQSNSNLPLSLVNSDGSMGSDSGLVDELIEEQDDQQQRRNHDEFGSVLIY